ncbi:MAG: hypothetical protein JNK49_08120 [Planctomycetes bacterium]|nr:hypothetical protein [Planctomycetota bacterium]
MRREFGKLGQFDVLVDGAVIAGRGSGPSRWLGGGFPDPEDVIAKLEALQQGAAKPDHHNPGAPNQGAPQRGPDAPR